MKFRKKPIIIEAVQWNGKLSDIKPLMPIENAVAPSWIDKEDNSITIHALEGNMKTQLGDWIIKGVKGECYPCKPDIFEATYEAIKDDMI